MEEKKDKSYFLQYRRPLVGHPSKSPSLSRQQLFSVISTDNVFHLNREVCFLPYFVQLDRSGRLWESLPLYLIVMMEDKDILLLRYAGLLTYIDYVYKLRLIIIFRLSEEEGDLGTALCLSATDEVRGLSLSLAILLHSPRRHADK